MCNSTFWGTSTVFVASSLTDCTSKGGTKQQSGGLISRRLIELTVNRMRSLLDGGFGCYTAVRDRLCPGDAVGVRENRTGLRPLWVCVSMVDKPQARGTALCPPPRPLYSLSAVSYWWDRFAMEIPLPSLGTWIPHSWMGTVRDRVSADGACVEIVIWYNTLLVHEFKGLYCMMCAPMCVKGYDAGLVSCDLFIGSLQVCR